MDLGGLIDNLVHGQGEKVPKHDIDHRSPPRHGRTDADADDTRLRNGRIDDAVRTQLLDKS